MVITIRLAKEEDQLKAQSLIIQTIRKINARDYSPEQIRLWCGTNRRPWKMTQNGKPIKRLLAFDGSKMVGVANGLNTAKHSIRGLYIAHTHLRRGIGSRLLKRLERWAEGNGWKELCFASTLTAVPFYEKMGYIKTRRGSHRLGRLVIPCVHMKKRLD